MVVCDDEKGASMNLWLRLIRVWLVAQRRSPLGADGESVIRIGVWPHDLDLWGHVNGGRYLTMSDLGRLDFSIRSGLFKIVRRQHWTMPMATAGLQFLRPLRLFQTCELHTQVVSWDDKWWYLETKFVRKGRTVATVVAKAAVRGPDGTITPKRLLELLGADYEPFPVPEHIRRWVEAEVIATYPVSRVLWNVHSPMAASMSPGS
jgi:acyl-CoA thioesterase FadM